MGTRNLVAVVVDGEYKISQYGQWDGYPSGQGVDVLNFLKVLDLTKLAEKARATIELTDAKRKELWAEVGYDIDAGNGFVSMKISDEFKKRNPHLDRDMAAGILEFITREPAGMLVERNLSFAADSLFCEYAYVVDLDKRTFEVFQGFNQSLLDSSERFAFLQGEGESREYYPVKHLQTFSLDDLPTREVFLEMCDPEGHA